MAAAGSLEAHQYTCAGGDSIDNLAISLHCSVDDFTAANPGLDLHNLQPGEVINLPHNAVVPDHGCGCAQGGHDDHSYGGNYGQQPQQPAAHSGDDSEYINQLHTAVQLISDAIHQHLLGPNLLRCAFHDAGNFNAASNSFGADGTLRFVQMQQRAEEEGLKPGIQFIETVKPHCPLVSYADLYQMGGALAVELAGGPHIPIRYGRIDAGEDQIPADHLLPVAATADPIGEITNKMMHQNGLNDQEVVALMGGHTLGRVFPENLGLQATSTQFTQNIPEAPGGVSWTKDPFTFDNNYFIELIAQNGAVVNAPGGVIIGNDLVVLSTDVALLGNPAWSQWVHTYAQDQNHWFTDYTAVHLKFSEWGVQWRNGQPITI